MSRQAIAAVLARQDLSSGERLVAFSLASFADRDGRARPGTPAAAGRAGLKRSWFLEARDMLERRGLVAVEDAATGRGRASTLWLPFVDAGPWWDGEINPELFEAVLSYGRSEGAARLLLAAMAALADGQRVVERVTTSQLCAAAGFSDRTYRRAHAGLLTSGELVLRSGSGGRGNTNCWEILDPRSGAGDVQSVSPRRVAPPPGQRPLLASVSSTGAIATEQHGRTGAAHHGKNLTLEGAKAGQERTVPGQKRPVIAGVSGENGGARRTLSSTNRPVSAGVSLGKGGAGRTVFVETPAQTPAETPAPNARAGREPQNPRTNDPPNPPCRGGGAERLFVEETFVTERGRTRRRRVAVDLSAVRKRLRAAGEADLAAWQQVRALLREAAGESTFEIWLAPLELIAVDLDGTLVVCAPAETVGWVTGRFGRVLDGAAQRAGRPLRVADEVERRAAGSLARCVAAVAADAQTAISEIAMSDPPAAGRADHSPRRPTYTSASPTSYTDVYNQSQEVS